MFTMGQIAKVEWDSKNPDRIIYRSSLYWATKGLLPKVPKKPTTLDTKAI